MTTKQERKRRTVELRLEIKDPTTPFTRMQVGLDDATRSRAVAIVFIGENTLQQIQDFASCMHCMGDDDSVRFHLKQAQQPAVNYAAWRDAVVRR